MKLNLTFEEAQELMLSHCGVVEAETVALSSAGRRILAQDIRAVASIPPFPRSPYDGYAFRAADSAGASRESPVILKVIEVIAAGQTPQKKIVPGAAARIMTGAPIPQGADAVIMYENTEFDEKTVKIFSAASEGMDIAPVGEDVTAGALLAHKGDLIDPALAGSLAAQGLARVSVHKRPKVGIISTGNELVEADQPISGGAIRNNTRYALEAASVRAGAEPIYLGRARDEVEEIAAIIERGLQSCEMIFISGGVSVGDYDFTPAAMASIGAKILARGLRLKPGGACAYGLKDDRLIFGLSGNPASALINFYCIAWPCLRKLCGYNQIPPKRTRVILTDGFNKKSPNARIISGRLDYSDGVLKMKPSVIQGNAILRSLIGCDVMAVIPAGSPPAPAGTTLEAFLID
jgi:molybdopterin molybdotransferase